MKPLRAKWHLLVLVGMLPMGGWAQTRETSSAAWLFSGISYRASPNVKISGHLGYLSPQDLKAVYLQTFIKVNKHLLLSPAYLGLVTPTGQGGIEHGLMNAVTFMISLSQVVM